MPHFMILLIRTIYQFIKYFLEKNKCVFLRNMEPLSLRAIQRGINENHCRAGWMYRLIWVFAGHRLIVGLLCAGSQYFYIPDVEEDLLWNYAEVLRTSVLRTSRIQMRMDSRGGQGRGVSWSLFESCRLSGYLCSGKLAEEEVNATIFRRWLSDKLRLTVRSWKILYCCKLCCIWSNQNKV